MLGLTEPVFDGGMRGFNYPFGLCPRQLQGLLPQILAQTRPQLLFEFGRNVRERDLETAAITFPLDQPLLDGRHLRLQRLKLGSYPLQVAGELLVQIFSCDVRRPSLAA